MEHYAGLDVSIKDTSVCVIDDSGRLVCEVKVESEPEAIVAVLADEAFSIKRIGLEAGPLSQWLFGELAEAGLPMICVETRHMRAALSAQVNKSDRNDAWHRPYDARGTVPTGSCQDAGQPKAPNTANQPPVAARQGARHRE